MFEIKMMLKVKSLSIPFLLPTSKTLNPPYDQKKLILNYYKPLSLICGFVFVSQKWTNVKDRMMCFKHYEETNIQ